MTATYATSTRLDEIRLGLSARDITVLRTLRAFRLATGDQLRRLHFRGHVSQRAAAIATGRSLRRLASLGLVDHITRRIGGAQAGSIGFAWHLTPTGAKLLARIDSQPLSSRSLFTEPTPRTTDHQLAITETAVRLHEAEEAGLLDLIEIDPEPSCWRTYLNPGGGTATLKPDLFAVTAGAVSDTEDVWFIEVDRGTESRATIARKAAQYEAYRRTGREQKAQSVFPYVAWIVPDENRADVIREVLSRNQRVPDGVHLAYTLDGFVAAVCQTETDRPQPP